MRVKNRFIKFLRNICIPIMSRPIRIIVERVGRDYDKKRNLFFKKMNQCNSKLKKCTPHARRTKY